MNTLKISSGSSLQPWSNLKYTILANGAVTGVLFKGIMKKHDSLE